MATRKVSGIVQGWREDSDDPDVARVHPATKSNKQIAVIRTI
jgi:hypothetical protein